MVGRSVVGQCLEVCAEGPEDFHILLCTLRRDTGVNLACADIQSCRIGVNYRHEFYPFASLLLTHGYLPVFVTVFQPIPDVQGCISIRAGRRSAGGRSEQERDGRTRDELKARLLTEAEQAIEGLLAEKSGAGTSRLDELEGLGLKGGAPFEASVLKAFGPEELAADDRVEQRCERGGSRMQRRGRQRRQGVTAGGVTRLAGAYYVCPGGGASLFPLDKRWGLEASGYRPALKRQRVWLSGLLASALAEAVLQRIGKRTISDSSLWRALERQGQRLLVDAASAKPVTPPSVPNETRGCWGKTLRMDGGRVNMRQEGWKELQGG